MKKIIIILLSLMTVPKLMFTPVLAQTKSMEIEKLMNRYKELEMINGVVLVAEGDKMLYKNAFGKANFEWNIPNQIDSKFEIASLSKQFTAIMVLQLIDQGLLSLNTKVRDVLKDYPEINGNKITIEHLLSHTSGLIDTRHIPNFDTNLGTQPYSRDKLLSTFKNNELLFEPGTKWSYSNFGYNLLAIILETITKKDINELIREKIFNPCGMTQSTDRKSVV